MKKYSESVLEYKNKFKSVQEAVNSTNDLFLNKYFYPKSQGGDKKFSLPFIPGQIYSFYYATSSEVNEKRKFIDRNPILLCTDYFSLADGGYILKGIDLIVTPPKRRVDILAKLFDNYHNVLTRNQELYERGGNLTPIALKDSFLERIFSNSGYKNSLFGFKLPSIRDVNLIPLEDWFKLPYLSESLVEGLQTPGIYSEYESKLI